MQLQDSHRVAPDYLEMWRQAAELRRELAELRVRLERLCEQRRKEYDSRSA